MTNTNKSDGLNDIILTVVLARSPRPRWKNNTGFTSEAHCACGLLTQTHNGRFEMRKPSLSVLTMVSYNKYNNYFEHRPSSWTFQR